MTERPFEVEMSSLRCNWACGSCGLSFSYMVPCPLLPPGAGIFLFAMTKLLNLMFWGTKKQNKTKKLGSKDFFLNATDI